MLKDPVCDGSPVNCLVRPSMSAALENKSRLSPRSSGLDISVRLPHPGCRQRGYLAREIIEQESRLDLTQLQLQFLAEETSHRLDYFGLLLFGQRHRHMALDLTRSSSAAPSGSATGCLQWYFNHDSGRKQAGPPIGRTGRGELGVCHVSLFTCVGCPSASSGP